MALVIGVRVYARRCADLGINGREAMHQSCLGYERRNMNMSYQTSC